MSLRKSIPMWMYVGLFFGSVVMVPLLYHLSRRPADPPCTLSALKQLLSQEEPSLHMVPVDEKHPECGIYVCTQPQPLEELMRLYRNPYAIGKYRCGRWQGVVHCERVSTNGFGIEEQQIQSWGEHGMRIGPFLFFGDPALLHRIQKAILGDHHA